MEIVKIEKPEIFLGEDRLIIKKFDNNNYNSLLKLLKNLGLKRNREAEQMIRKYALKGYKKLVLDKTKNRGEFNEKIKEYKKERKESDLKEGIFESRINSFHFIHCQKAKFLSGGWKSKKFNKSEFFSLLLSNN